MGKLSAEVEKTVVETQQMVLNGFNEQNGQVRLPAWIDAIKQVADTPDDLLKNCLGETGKRLKRFAVRVNSNHPDLEIFPEIEGGGHLAALFRSVMPIIDRAKSSKEVVNEEKQLIALPSLLRLIQQPRTRLLCGLQDRCDQRSIKKQVKNIGLKEVLKGGENSFYGRPEHFKRFARNSKFYIEEMQALEARQTTFQKHGMQELAHVFAKRMRSLEESIHDTCGFFRLKPDEAAVTLARLHGFRWNETSTISVPSKNLDGDFFSSSATIEVKDDVENLKKTVILNTKFAPSGQATTNLNYQPRMYPLPHFPAPLPEMASKVIDRAEHFALLNDNPFFDYYWVLVPSINMNHPLIMKTKDHWTIKEGHANLVFDDPIKAATELDGRLVKEGYIVPIIIGERDGKCFFVCMFS